MGRSSKTSSQVPSRRDFIAGGSALLAAAAGARTGHAAEISASSVDGSAQQGANGGDGNALYHGPAPANAIPQRWKASWITSKKAPRKEECILRFRKEFELTSKPSRFVIHVSADNRYLLKVNGKYVGNGPSHSDVKHWKFTTYDIAPMLREGKNLIAATAWNAGANAPVRQISDLLGFLLEGEEGNPVDVDSNDTWSVATEKGMTILPMPVFPQHYYYVATAT